MRVVKSFKHQSQATFNLPVSGSLSAVGCLFAFLTFARFGPGAQVSAAISGRVTDPRGHGFRRGRNR